MEDLLCAEEDLLCAEEDLTFAHYLEKIGVIDDACHVPYFILRISLENFYECYVTYCKDNNLVNEDLSREFFALTGRKNLREIRFVF